MEQFKNFPLVLSGLNNFDEKQGGFVPSMYVLGATPSLEKAREKPQILSLGDGCAPIFYYFKHIEYLIMKKYRTTETTVYCCRYHIIFCPKYRRKVLREPIAERFKQIVMSMQEEQNFYVLGMEVMPDRGAEDK